MAGNNGGGAVKSDETLLAIVDGLVALDGATITELKEHVGVSKSTVHRHLTTLERHQYVVKEGDTYHVGLRFLDLGGYARDRKAAHKIVEPKVGELAEETGQICQFIVEEHSLGVFLYREWAGDTVRTGARVGTRSHLHQTAAGKAILSQLPPARVDEIVDRWGLPGETEHTITERDELAAELETIRDRGYSVDKDEHTEGLWAVGAPVNGPDGGVLGGLSVAGPTHRMKGKFEEEIPGILLRIANECQLDVAYSRRL
ncbi:IclR family transcriptional regulator [Halobacteriales archaeon QS_1_68_17]|nr:MAG: IclR family transcriptional regulator [Halobacteriales archaeon QS_1_68_17]